MLKILEKVNINLWIELVRYIHDEILKIYNNDFEVYFKEDKSPLTEADRLVSNIIYNKLNIWFPEIPIICEERKEISYEERKNWEYYFLIDPIDGTKEFIKKNGEFTVNIGLCYKNRPIFGIVTIPVDNIMYYGELNNGSYKINLNENKTGIEVKSIQLKPKDNTNRDIESVNIIVSRSHLDDMTIDYINTFKNKYKNLTLIKSGSSIKFMKIAENEADIYPRFGPTMEWDTCASHIIVEESGKNIYSTIDNSILKYNKENLKNDNFICANL